MKRVDAADRVQTVADALTASKDALTAALSADETGNPETVIDALVETIGRLVKAQAVTAEFAGDAWRLAVEALGDLDSRTSAATAAKKSKSEELRRRAILLRAKGKSIPEIAKQIDRHERQVSRYLSDDTPTKRQANPDKTTN